MQTERERRCNKAVYLLLCLLQFSTKYPLTLCNMPISVRLSEHLEHCENDER